MDESIGGDPSPWAGWTAILPDVTRTFSPRDALRLHRMQTSGASFDLEGDVLLGRAPVPQALGAWLPLPERNLVTLVLDEGESGCPSGFVQGRRHRDGIASEVTFLAPGIEAASGAALTWHRLVGDLCARAASNGVRSLFVTVGQEEQVALQVFRGLGFSPFNADTVLRRAASSEAELVAEATSASSSADVPERHFISPQPEHESAIDGLLHAIHPPTVRVALADRTSWRGSPLGGMDLRGERSAIQVDAHGAPLGAWRLLPGKSGHWLRAVAGPQGDSVQLVKNALAILAGAGWADLPIYASACGYEPALHLALREHGFRPVASRFRLVKHTTVRRLAPAWSEQPAALRAAARTRPAAQSRARAASVDVTESQP
jgi:hypothetical protein